MAGFRYLTSDHLQGFNKYKYNSKETSPLAIYVILPTWNKLLKFVPLWMAPNLLTFIGWLLLMLNFFLLAYFDWDFNTSTNSRGLKRQPIPSSVWVFCGVSQLVSYALDGMDGKQARRTSSSTPLGELFDHGCDSWATILLPLGLISAIGRGVEFGGTPTDSLLPCISTIAGFYLFHWEKYITGCLYIPWFYDLIQLGCSAAYVATGVFGVELWHFYVYPGWSFAYVLKYLLIVAFFGGIPTSLWNIYDYYSKPNLPEDQSQTAGSPTPPIGRKLGLIDALSPLLPFLILTILYLVWAHFSPTDIIEREPRIYVFSIGVIFSNVTCRLIISQMTSQPAQLFNLLLVPLAMSVLLSFLFPRYEMAVLYTYSLVILVSHLHYVISIMAELCQHFHIYAFSLAKREPIS